MPSRYKRRLRSIVAIALACLYMFMAAGVSVSGAHEQARSPCHGYGAAVVGIASLANIAADNRFDKDATRSDDSGAVGQFDSGCQFCSAIASGAQTLAPHLIAVDIPFQDRSSNLFGQFPSRLPRPPQSLIAS